MRKRRKEEKHTKGWTLLRAITMTLILCFEIFAVYWLLIYEQQPIACVGVFIFLVMPTLPLFFTFWSNYRKKYFLNLIEGDLEEDQRLAQQYGVAYYVWKALTLPFIVKNGEQKPDEKIVKNCVNLIVENEELKNQLTLKEKALELACEELYDSDSISICNYCPYDIEDECADECPQNTRVLEKYFQAKAKEMKSE